MRLNLFLYKLENKISRFAVEKLTNLICGCMLIVLIADLIIAAGGYETSLFGILYFDRGAVFSLQIWRVFTFLLIYPDGSITLDLYDILLALLEIYVIYWSGNTVENYLGKARFNLYVIFGIILTLAAGFITGYTVNYYLYLSFFMIFTALYPEERILLFFILPIKAKWFGIVEGLFLLINLILGGWAEKAAIIAMLIDFFIFFGYGTINKIKYDYREYKWRKGRPKY